VSRLPVPYIATALWSIAVMLNWLWLMPKVVPIIALLCFVVFLGIAILWNLLLTNGVKKSAKFISNPGQNCVGISPKPESNFVWQDWYKSLIVHTLTLLPKWLVTNGGIVYRMRVVSNSPGRTLDNPARAIYQRNLPIPTPRLPIFVCSGCVPSRWIIWNCEEIPKIATVINTMQTRNGQCRK